VKSSELSLHGTWIWADSVPQTYDTASYRGLSSSFTRLVVSCSWYRRGIQGKTCRNDGLVVGMMLKRRISPGSRALS
jgi:hypothetical protein